MRAPVVVDTNVVVSGLLTRDDRAPTARILDGMLRGAFQFLLSTDLLAEYRAVLLRPAISARHGLNELEVDAVLTTVATNAAVREPAAGSPPGPDPGDEHLWALLATDSRAVLVTGERLLLRKPPPGASGTSPADFVATLA